jgi:taurine dioxygenase
VISITRMPGPFGADVTGIESAEQLVDVATIALLADALAEHRVLIVETPEISEEQFARFGGRWGTPIAYFNPRDRDAAHPELIRITNSPKMPAQLRDGAMHWHQDSSYESPPASITMLHAIEAPATNDTRFVDMIAAYRTLDPGLQRRMAGLVVQHRSGGGHPDLSFPGEVRGESTGAGAHLPDVTHPLVVRHPVSGAPALYGLSGTAVGIAGMPDGEAIPLLRLLKEHALRSVFEQRARAEVGTILIWDNIAVMHCATPTAYSDRDGERRLLHRISLRCVHPLEPFPA